MKNLINEQLAAGLNYKTLNLLTDLDSNFAETVADLALKAPKASPAFTGTVTGITKSMVGLGNCDNTSDANKPVSTATTAALALKANIASPTLTGVPAAPTAAAGTNTTQLATTAFVTTAVAASRQYQIYTNGVVTFRTGVRGSSFVLDQTITATGFDGVEDTDWANVRSESL